MNKNTSLSQSQEAGFTIIEALLAIIVVGIFVTSLGPVIALSVATRVQARRVELGTQAARGYLDGVRSGGIEAPEITDTELSEVDVPRERDVTSCEVNNNDDENGYCDSDNTLYCVDGDGDGECTSENPKDFIIQAFGYNEDDGADDNEERADSGYQLGIRVYRGDAFGTDGNLKRTEEEEEEESAKASTITGGLGDQKAPLVEMTTEITTTSTTYSDFCDRIGEDDDDKTC